MNTTLMILFLLLPAFPAFTELWQKQEPISHLVIDTPEYTSRYMSDEELRKQEDLLKNGGLKVFQVKQRRKNKGRVRINHCREIEDRIAYFLLFRNNLVDETKEKMLNNLLKLILF